MDEHESNAVKSLSVALGVLIGVTPLYGFHLPIGVSLAHLFKLNKVITGIATNISIPPLVPLIIFVSYKLGEWVMPNAVAVEYHTSLSANVVKENLIQYAIGNVLLGIILGVILGIATYFTLNMYYSKKKRLIE